MEKLLRQELRLIPAAVHGEDLRGSPVGPPNSRAVDKNVSKPKCTLTKDVPGPLLPQPRGVPHFLIHSPRATGSASQ